MTDTAKDRKIYDRYLVNRDGDGLYAVFSAAAAAPGTGARYRAAALPEAIAVLEAEGYETALMREAQAQMLEGKTTAQREAAINPPPKPSPYGAPLIEMHADGPRVRFTLAWTPGSSLPAFIHGAQCAPPVYSLEDLPGVIAEQKRGGYDTQMLEYGLRRLEALVVPTPPVPAPVSFSLKDFADRLVRDGCAQAIREGVGGKLRRLKF